jgi:AAA15 family ATPase/GTPase
MEKYIKHISGTIPHTNKQVDIALDGKNLIITGANGSGKTSFLRNVYNKTFLLIAEKQQADLPLLKQQLQNFEHMLSQQTKGTSGYDQWQNNVKRQKTEIEAITRGLVVAIPDNIEFSALYDERRAVIQFYEEKRFANIAEAKTAQGLQTEIDENKKIAAQQNVGSKLEQHLLNLKTRRSLALTEDHDTALAETIDAWFSDFEKNLTKLFEDDSIRLVFNSNANKFSFRQKGKEPYAFQTLSAGYNAIFDIYADLLMRTEYFAIKPPDLRGAIFIDEIETHLHISLQRLIFPFFTKSFPGVQFIATTHSPFVLMSAPDTLVFDLEKEEPSVITQVKTQTEVLNDYLGVPVTMPIWAEERLNRILNNYLTKDADSISLETMRTELENEGLAVYFPEAAAKLLEAK